MAIDYAWLETKILNRSLSAEERDKLGNVLAERHFAKGEAIIKQGDSGGLLYIVRSGSVSIDIGEGEGKRSLGAALSEGAPLGWMSFLTDDPAMATLSANSDCELYELRRDDCSDLMQSEPEIVYAFLAYIVIFSGKVVRKMNDDHVATMLYMTSSHR